MDAFGNSAAQRSGWRFHEYEKGGVYKATMHALLNSILPLVVSPDGSTRARVLIGTLMFFSAATGSAIGPAVSPGKKLIALASNVHVASPAYLRQHINEMEKHLPLDGLIICVYHDT